MTSLPISLFTLHAASRSLSLFLFCWQISAARWGRDRVASSSRTIATPLTILQGHIPSRSNTPTRSTGHSSPRRPQARNRTNCSRLPYDNVLSCRRTFRLLLARQSSTNSSSSSSNNRTSSKHPQRRFDIRHTACWGMKVTWWTCHPRRWHPLRASCRSIQMILAVKNSPHWPLLWDL